MTKTTIAPLFLLLLVVLSSAPLDGFDASSTTRTKAFTTTRHHRLGRQQPSSVVVLSATEGTKKAEAEKEKKNEQLLQDLESKFDYEGRLPGITEKGTEFRCGFVSILGAANMGKSTLLNALLKEDLCIATRRPQTTRHAILGVMTTDDCQVCLFDTPGIIDNPAYKLQEGMMEAVMGAFYDADVLIVVTDLFSTPIPDDDIFQKVQTSQKPTIVVINKIDLADKVNPNSDVNEEEGRTVTVEDAVAKWRALLPNSLAILPVAASEGINNEGVIALRKLLVGGDDLPAAIRDLGRPIPGMFQPGVTFLTDDDAKALLPPSPPLYDEEILTDRPERFFASEIIRGCLFETLKKELPYCCEVRIDEFKEPKPDDKKQVIRIKASIFVERDSQKLIVIGKGGSQIKEVGSAAREKLEDFLETKVFLDLMGKSFCFFFLLKPLFQ
jgi:small GTP-binding protein